MNHARPIGISILALFCMLIGLLGLLASGSYYLMGSAQGQEREWVSSAVTMLVLCGSYFLLGFSLWTLRAWARWFAPILLLVLASVALVDLMRNEVLDLAAALMFLLAAAANMAVIAWLRQPGVRELF